MLALVAGVREPKIVLGMLIEIFRGDAVVGGRGLPRKRDVALEDLMGGPADSYAGAVAIVVLAALWRSRLRLDGSVAVIGTARPSV